MGILIFIGFIGAIACVWLCVFRYEINQRKFNKLEDIRNTENITAAELLEKINKAGMLLYSKSMCLEDANNIIITMRDGKFAITVNEERIIFKRLVVPKRNSKANDFFEEGIYLYYFLQKVLFPITTATPEKISASYEFNKKFRNVSIVLAIIGLGGVATIFVKNEFFVNYVSEVREATPDGYSETWGDAFDNFFGEPKWESFNSDTGEKVVEFTGNCYSEDVLVDVTIQFVFDDAQTGNKNFTLNYLDFDGQSQDTTTLQDLMNTAFE